MQRQMTLDFVILPYALIMINLTYVSVLLRPYQTLSSLLFPVPDFKRKYQNEKLAIFFAVYAERTFKTGYLSNIRHDHSKTENS